MKYKVLAIIFSCMISIACSDWLNVQPKTSTPEEELFNSEFGFCDALTGLYLKMCKPELYGKELTYGYVDMLAGNYSQIPDIYNMKELCNYEGTFKSTKNTFYEQMYNIIANINNFLHYIEIKKDVLKTPTYYEVMTGEALGLRAFLHFDLLRLFGPIHSQNPMDKAIAYRNSFDNIATTRLTSDEVLNLCIEDLKTAEILLEETDSEIFLKNKSNDAFLNLRQFRMNKWAVKALLARIYCYKGDASSKVEALRYAKEVINSNFFPLAEDNSICPIMFQEHIFSLYIYEMNKIVDQDFVHRDISTILSLSQEKWEILYERMLTDIRTKSGGFREASNNGKIIKILTKFSQDGYHGYDPTAYSGESTMPLIRIPEMYYIVAECETDPYLSAEYLDMVRFQRAISVNDATLVTPSYDKLDDRGDEDNSHTFRMNEIMKEYRKEYYGEGQLFFFYKRNNYQSYLNSPLPDMKNHFQLPLHENELIFGKQ